VSPTDCDRVKKVKDGGQGTLKHRRSVIIVTIISNATSPCIETNAVGVKEESGGKPVI
jgi:hypothetical protein